MIDAQTPLTPQFEPLLPSAKPPANLNAAARAHYRSVLESAPAGWFTIADVPALATYAALLARIDTVTRAVDALKSEVCDTSHGPAVHPSVRLADLLSRRAAQLRYELRLNPAARNKATTLTKLGHDRAAREAGARARANEDHSDRSALLFGGARAAKALEQ